MGFYRKLPVVIEARQWLKDGDHEKVRSRRAEILFDRAGNYFYISHGDANVSMASHWLAVDPASSVAANNGVALPFALASHWLAVDPASSVAANNGVALPFAFYELKSGKTEPLASHPALTERYMASMGWATIPRDMGIIDTLAGAHMVSPGDWIIKGVHGEFYPCKPDIFEKTYEQVEE